MTDTVDMAVRKAFGVPCPRNMVGGTAVPQETPAHMIIPGEYCPVIDYTEPNYDLITGAREVGLICRAFKCPLNPYYHLTISLECNYEAHQSCHVVRCQCRCHNHG